jgi:hypothetical protein
MRAQKALLTCAALAFALFVGKSLVRAHGIERSRGSLIELSGYLANTIYKHDANLDRVDSDSYASELIRPTWTASARYYMQGGNIVRIGNSSDSLSIYAPITAPPGMLAHSMGRCGDRICIVFYDNCTNGHWKVGGFAQGGDVIWSQEFSLVNECVLDATDQSGDLVVMTQFIPPAGNAFAFCLVKFNAQLEQFNLCNPVPLRGIAQAIAAHREDPASVFILDTRSPGQTSIHRVSLVNGSIIASSDNYDDGEGTFAPFDIAHFPATDELVLLTYNTGINKYDLAAFDQSLLTFKRKRRFDY